ncbi:SET and MYND domain-containing protein 4 isoform X2 [Procambarus clarkii]|nr:SET and MYND domain-containing protein 4-like isoform X2 [Procambarus clarkii]
MQAKNIGSKAYLKKKDAEALKNFTECLRLAPADSSLLPLAYANRSAVLFQMGKYEEALQDMNRAEECGYPAALRHKLLTRRCHCYLILGEEDHAKASLEVCKRHSELVSPDSKEKYEKTVADLEKKMDSSGFNQTNRQEVLGHPSLLKGENAVVKYMTSVFEMRTSEKYGRHIVATDAVSKGSVVFVEKPYAAILLPEYHSTHCHNCFTPATNPVPCKYCCDAVFCKEECRELGRAWHQYECGILHILSSVGIAHLAVRVILVTGWKHTCDIRNEAIEGRVEGVGENGVYNGNDVCEGYRAVYHLMPHFDSCLPEDQLQYCLAAILLATAVLDKTDFPKHNEVEMMNEDCLDVAHLASAIMRHIAQLVSNAHAVTQIMASSCGERSKVEQVSQKRIASAIYPTASLMNHSCKPNIINSFQKDLLIIRTIEDVNPNDQIFNCYGPHYCRQTRQERQESLKRQYFFTCKCVPCTQPEYLQKEASWSGFCCEKCRGVLSWMGENDPTGSDLAESGGVFLCLKCHTLQRPSAHLMDVCAKVNSLHEAGEEALQKGDVPGAVTLLRNALSKGSEVYLPENQYFTSVRDTLACALSDLGDFKSCCLELRECLRVVESRYGSKSIEFAHELLKFSDVLTLASASNDKLKDEVEGVKSRIDEIFTLNYGPQWKMYLQM